MGRRLKDLKENTSNMLGQLWRESTQSRVREELKAARKETSLSGFKRQIEECSKNELLQLHEYIKYECFEGNFNLKKEVLKIVENRLKIL